MIMTCSGHVFFYTAFSRVSADNEAASCSLSKIITHGSQCIIILALNTRMRELFNYLFVYKYKCHAAHGNFPFIIPHLLLFMAFCRFCCLNHALRTARTDTVIVLFL